MVCTWVYIYITVFELLWEDNAWQGRIGNALAPKDVPVQESLSPKTLDMASHTWHSNLAKTG